MSPQGLNRGDGPKDMGAIPGSRASTEPCSTVSALTGFDPARVLQNPLTDEQIKWRVAGDCDLTKYRELRAQEVDSFVRGLEFHEPLGMVLTVLRNAALYSPWYGNAHHLYNCCADVIEAAIATEAGTAATVKQGAVHEGAGPQDIAQNEGSK